MTHELLTPTELCKWLQISRQTLWKYLREKKHPIPTSGAVGGRLRFSRADVEKWLRDNEKRR